MAIFNQVVAGSGGGSAPQYYIEKTVDANGKLSTGTGSLDFSGVKDVAEYALSRAFYGVTFPANTQLDLSSITTLSGNNCCDNAFYNTKNIISVDLSSLQTISGGSACVNMFSSSAQLVNINMSNLKTINGNNACAGMFSVCGSIENIYLNALETISTNSMGAMFANCYLLQNVYLNKFNPTVQICPSYQQMFNGCTKLENVYLGGLVAATFGSVQNQFQYLFGNTTGSSAPNGCTVHFPSNFDPSDPNHTFDASTLAGYPTFGGSASYIHVAFDLPATE